ncbi:MAG: C-GCAxxG-C-C family protein [Planctomycetota bacterium]|jgi:hypothetical protein
MRNHKEKTGRNGRLYKSRRGLPQLAGIGLFSSLLTGQAEGGERCQPEFKVLGENDQIDIGDKGREIIEKAYKLGHDFEKKHMGCCRCTVAALQSSIDFVPKDKDLFRAASCLDRGATPTGIQSCGAFTGSGMMIGWTCGAEGFGDTGLSHKLIRKVYKRFEKEYGNVLCKDVRKKINRNCPEVVARAAKWTAEVLLRQFTNYE